MAAEGLFSLSVIMGHGLPTIARYRVRKLLKLCVCVSLAVVPILYYISRAEEVAIINIAYM